MGSKRDGNRIVVVSLDAVGSRDQELLLSLPNFSRIVREGAYCDNVLSVYPSLTYPAHASIVTGKTPDHHRVVSNTLLQPGRKTPDWMYSRKNIRGITLMDLARKKGYRVATLLWPVTGGAKIAYNLPEVMVTRKHQNQIIACLLNGSPKYLLELNSKFGHMRKGISQPFLDDFLMESTKYTIEKYNPEVIFLHLTDVDTNRHNFGVDAPEIREALLRHDERLGKLLNWLSETGSLENTTFIVLGDHCQVDASGIVYLNKLFADKGYITLEGDRIVDYKAIVKSCDGSAYVYLNDSKPMDIEFLEELTDTLNAMKADERLGIEDIFTSEEAADMGADSNCFAMLEAKQGYYFLEETEVLTENVADTKNHKMLAIHGCLNTREDNRTFFAAMGKGIKKGARIDSMYLWDEGPTIAKLMGSHIPGADGRVISEFLE